MWKWWIVEAVDPVASVPWNLYVPAKQQADAIERLWKFGLITGAPQPWRFREDPELDESRANMAELNRGNGVKWSCFNPAQGRVWQTLHEPIVTLASLQSVIDLDAEPSDRHFLLQAFVDGKRFPSVAATDDVAMWACWQWMAEWPTFHERWMRRDDTGECERIPTVLPPWILARLLKGKGDQARSAWVERVALRIEEISHSDRRLRFNLF
jgi:hypothetical protein